MPPASRGLRGGRVLGAVAAFVVVLLAVARRSGNGAGAAPPEVAASAPLPVAAPQASTPQASTPTGFIRSIAADYKAVGSLVGLLVYGVVRVSYDAYYTRLGVFPEAVGLTETTILGRAVLYLAMTASIAAIVGGLWFLVSGWGLQRCKELTPSRMAAVIAGATLAAAALVASAGQTRHLLASRDFAYYCLARCKFQPLDPETMASVRAQVPGVQASPGSKVVELGPAWLLGLPLVLLLTAAGLVLLLDRSARLDRIAARATFGVVAAASLSAGLLAPYGIRLLEDAAALDGSSPVLRQVGLLRLLLSAFVLVAVGSGLLASVTRLDTPRPDTAWRIACFVVVLPLLLGLVEPDVARFLAEEGLLVVLAAVGLWIVLLWAGFVIWPDLVARRLKVTPKLAAIVALIVVLTLFLAWARGINYAKKAASGDQIYPARFSLISVRANVVCLEQAGKPTPKLLRRRPYTYLGQANGTLILYDYLADSRHKRPTAFPVRLPAGDAVVRLAEYDAERRAWSC
jgi:hypothetical protein